MHADRVSSPEAFRRHAEQSPDRVVVEDIFGRTVTNAQLHQEAIRYAGALRRAGIQSGDRVASLLNNSIETIQLWLGIGWAHALDVSVNTAYRGDILKYVLGDSGSKLVFVEAPFLDAFVEIADALTAVETVVVLGAPPPAGLRARTMTFEDFLAAGAAPDDLVAPGMGDLHGIVYTSGTTGVSKGVLIAWGRHGGGAACTMFRRFLGANDVWYSPFPACHNSAKIPLRIAAHLGCRVVIAPGFKTDRFWHDVRKFGCTSTLLLPNMLHWLVKAPPVGEDRDHPLVEVVGYGTDLGPFGDRFGVRVHCNYGNTEAGNTLFHLDVGNAPDGYSGRAHAPFEARIVGPEDYELPRGTQGELVTRCNEPWMVFQGYHRMPEETLRILRNGWYHTGDLFRMDDEGGVWFVDRHADYIRRRGENISSFEVEKIVMSHPKIREVAAIGIKSAEGEDEVKICIAFAAGEAVEPGELIQFLAPRMPRFMLPRYIEILAELPKTPATHRVRKAELREGALNANTWDAGPSRSARQGLTGARPKEHTK